jgi:hypothetical protein
VWSGQLQNASSRIGEAFTAWHLKFEVLEGNVL